MRGEVVFIEASTTGAGALANEVARAEGYRAVLFTRDSARYGPDILATTDEIVGCETNDSAEVLAAMRRRSRHAPVAAVTTTADMYVPQAALAAEGLGLPGLRYQAALSARNKHRMRVALEERATAHNVPFALARNPAEALAAAEVIGYPLVVKPQEENDGWGVRLIQNRADLTEYMPLALGWSRNCAGQMMPPGALLEAYVSAPEFSVETIQYSGGQCQVMGVTTKEMTGLERGRFVETGHCFPYAGREATIAANATRRVLNALEIDHGAIHTECRVEGDEVKIMEINPRLAGGKIGSHLIEMATGCSAVRAVVDAALGVNAEWRPRRSRGAAIHFVWADHPGVFGGVVNSSELLAMNGVTSVAPLAQPGARVRLPLSNRDYLAEILATGRTAADAYANVKAALACVRVSIAP